ncbi:TetR/AcrR family transcriptional regulator [Pseudomonas taiwanensis]|uniref:TetR/AcrR family transcriptional regulator n=1 Tax=Pseudomonas taiwanensis TaxID=470150 RepID=UPI001645D3A2|nr:TetR/AcrR family transcriptional regulator [Pseudomonas taiwanensis]MBC3492451.1 TetR/AcrR family transcriptional regulator [Pseudomonas taiwanensis]
MNYSLVGKGKKVVDRADVIRAAAIRLFAAEGFQSVSLRRIADFSGVQVGSLYNHIDGKQELLFELIYETEKNLLDVLKSAVAAQNNPLDKIKTYVESYYRYAYSNRELHMLAVREKRCLDSDSAARLRDTQMSHERLVIAMLHEASKGGLLKVTDHTFSVRFIWSLLDGMVVRDDIRKSEVSDAVNKLKSAVTRLLGAD